MNQGDNNFIIPMKKLNASIIKEAESHVRDLLDNELSENCLFHTIKHTMDVVSNAEIIAEYANSPRF